MAIVSSDENRKPVALVKQHVPSFIKAALHKSDVNTHVWKSRIVVTNQKKPVIVFVSPVC